MPVADQTTVHVALGARSYDIVIGAANLPEVGAYLVDQARASHAIIISDHHVAPLYGQTLASDLSQRISHVSIVEVAAGESSKSVLQADRLWELLLQRGADRKTCIVAVGGGVVGDLAGFVAATYARGIPLIQV